MVQVAGSSNLAFNGTLKINADKKAVENFVRSSDMSEVLGLTTKLMLFKNTADCMLHDDDILHISIKERDGVPGDIRVGVWVQVAENLSDAYHSVIKMGPDKHRQKPDSTFGFNGILELMNNSQGEILNKIANVRVLMQKAVDALKNGKSEDRKLLSPEDQESAIKEINNRFIDKYS